MGVKHLVYSQDTSLLEVNSFSPLMPTSPSSMINQYKFEDEPELKDLFITVDDPESHITAIETFITYRVVTQVSFLLMYGLVTSI